MFCYCYMLKKVIRLFVLNMFALSMLLCGCALNLNNKKKNENKQGSNISAEVIIFNQFSDEHPVYFGLNNDKIQNKDNNLMKHFAKSMNKLYDKKIKFLATNVCDNAKSYNVALATKRAKALEKELQSKGFKGTLSIREWCSNVEADNKDANQKVLITASR